jgi:hypothetical protein
MSMNELTPEEEKKIINTNQAIIDAKKERRKARKKFIKRLNSLKRGK